MPIRTFYQPGTRAPVRQTFEPDGFYQPGTRVPVKNEYVPAAPPPGYWSQTGQENASVWGGTRRENTAGMGAAASGPGYWGAGDAAVGPGGRGVWQQAPPPGMRAAGGMTTAPGPGGGVPAGMMPGGNAGGTPALPGTSMVDELLRGKPISSAAAGIPVGPGAGSGAQAAGIATGPGAGPGAQAAGITTGPGPSGWGGAMTGIRLTPGESLLERPRGYTGREGDAGVLGARAEQFDRNFANYLRAGGWRSREEFERGAAALPGAGEEILGHVQARVAEAMPASMREELALEQVNRQALRREAAEGVMQEARLARYLEGASPEEVAAFHKNYQPVPGGGFRKITQPGNAISDEEYREWAVRVSPDEKKEFLANYVNTPRGWVSKRAGGVDMIEALESIMPGGKQGAEAPAPTPTDDRNWFMRTFVPKPPEPAGGTNAPPGVEQSFESEAAARAAGKKTGDVVVVGGQRWRLD